MALWQDFELVDDLEVENSQSDTNGQEGEGEHGGVGVDDGGVGVQEAEGELAVVVHQVDGDPAEHPGAGGVDDDRGEENHHKQLPGLSSGDASSAQ